MARSETPTPPLPSEGDPSSCNRDRAAARAALSVCESLMLALIDAGFIGAEEMRGVMEDAMRAHAGETADAIDAEAVKEIDRMISTIAGVGPK